MTLQGIQSTTIRVGKYKLKFGKGDHTPAAVAHANAKGSPVKQHCMHVYGADGVQLHAAVQAELRGPPLCADEDDHGNMSFDGTCNHLKVLYATSLLCCPKSLFTY